jgi:hypothetical protein
VWSGAGQYMGRAVRGEVVLYGEQGIGSDGGAWLAGVVWNVDALDVGGADDDGGEPGMSGSVHLGRKQTR